MLYARLSFLLFTAWVVRDVTCLSLGNQNVRVVESERDNSMSRRSCLTKVVGGLSIVATASATGVKPSLAEELPPPSSESFEASRTRLMQLIRDPVSSSNEAKVLAAIEDLVPFDPSQKKGASFVEDLDGEWELLWSAKAEAFSPLLKLPKPFKPDSFQYLGSAAAGEVGPDRVAQGLTGGILGPNQLWLSSGVRTSSSDALILEILPPFRFEVGGRYQTGAPKKRLVEAGSPCWKMKLLSIDHAMRMATNYECGIALDGMAHRNFLRDKRMDSTVLPPPRTSRVMIVLCSCTILAFYYNKNDIYFILRIIYCEKLYGLQFL